MKNTFTRKSRVSRLKSEDCRVPEDSSEMQLAKTVSKLSTSEIKYSDLLSRIHKFISETSYYLDPVLHTLPQRDQERLQSDIQYFLTTSDSIYTPQLFKTFRQDMLEKLNSKDFSKENFKQLFANGLHELYTGVSVKENYKYKKRFNLTEEKRELTPVRNIRQSTSPGERPTTNYQKENSELKSNLSEIIKQRDLLKAWKENVTKFPNLELEAQKIIKDFKEESELLAMKNNCNLSKLSYIVNSIQKFLKTTSKVQKNLREKEGFLSWNFYEDERSKLEFKLREVLDCNDLNWKPPPGSPLRTFESEGKMLRALETASRTEIRRRSREVQGNLNEKINARLIEEITKQCNEKVENLNVQIGKLESDNRKLKNKYYIVKKEIKQVKTTENQKKIEIFETFFNQKSVNSLISRKFIDKQFGWFLSNCEGLLKKIFVLVEEKNLQISNLKINLTKALQANLKTLMSLNESAEEQKVEIIKNYQVQIESLESSLIQHKVHSERKIKDLEESNLGLETNKTKSAMTIKTLESEISVLTKEKNIYKDSEKHLKIQISEINELKSKNSELNEKIQFLEKSDLLAQQYKLQKDLLEQENRKLVKEMTEKIRKISENEKKVRDQLDELNNKINELELEKAKLLDVLSNKEFEGKIVKNFMSVRNFQIKSLEEDREYLEKKENLNEGDSELEEKSFPEILLVGSKQGTEEDIKEDFFVEGALDPLKNPLRINLKADSPEKSLGNPEIFGKKRELSIEQSTNFSSNPFKLFPTDESFSENQKLSDQSLKLSPIYQQVHQKTQVSMRPASSPDHFSKHYHPDPIQSFEKSNSDPDQFLPFCNPQKSELLAMKKHSIFTQLEKETLEIELKKQRETHKTFESFLKYRIKQLETGEIFMNKVDLNKYNCF